MPHVNRIQDAGYIHHVISRGNNREPLFHNPEDFQFYLSLLDEARQSYSVKIYNFCLMSNHLHLLVEPQEDGALSKFMEYITKGYARYFNKTYDRVGHVFEGRFRSFLVQEEKYFVVCSRYIDMNPVSAGMVRAPKEYRWSGHAVLGYGEKGVLKLDLSDAYVRLGNNPSERQVAYRALVMNYFGDELDLLARRSGILGDAEFIKKIKSL